LWSCMQQQTLQSSATPAATVLSAVENAWLTLYSPSNYSKKDSLKF
jgi:hypothetical protein